MPAPRAHHPIRLVRPKAEMGQDASFQVGADAYLRRFSVRSHAEPATFDLSNREPPARFQPTFELRAGRYSRVCQLPFIRRLRGDRPAVRVHLGCECAAAERFRPDRGVAHGGAGSAAKRRVRWGPITGRQGKRTDVGRVLSTWCVAHFRHARFWACCRRDQKTDAFQRSARRRWLPTTTTAPKR